MENWMAVRPAAPAQVHPQSPQSKAGSPRTSGSTSYDKQEFCAVVAMGPTGSGGGGGGERGTRCSGVFCNVDHEQMKAEVRKNLIRPQYDVRSLYHEQGVFQHIARHWFFDNMTLVVISFNALWLSVDTDLNKATVVIQADPIFQIVEHMFCVYFSFEWSVRFMSFKRKRDSLSDGWFLFDSCLVLLMVAETWVMTLVVLASGAGQGTGLGNASILRLARLMRLSRMARMVRLFRACPELLILIKGMVAATRSVFFTLCLLIIVLYIFGIAMRQLSDGQDSLQEFFPTVPGSMYTLLIYGTFLDNLGDIAYALLAASPVCTVLFWVFVLLSTLTVLNMLVGVLCEVVSAVAASEKEALVVNFVKERMDLLFKKLDSSHDGKISKEEFLGCLAVPEGARLLAEVGVDVLSLIDQADTIFHEEMEDGEPTERELTFTDLMEVVLELRGTNHASVKHIMDLRKYFMASISQTNKAIARLETRLAASEDAALAANNASPRKPLLARRVTDTQGLARAKSKDGGGSGSGDLGSVPERQSTASSLGERPCGVPPAVPEEAAAQPASPTRAPQPPARLDAAGWPGPLPPLVPPVPLLQSPRSEGSSDGRTLVERLEQLAIDVQAEIQREVTSMWNCGQGSAFAGGAVPIPQPPVGYAGWAAVRPVEYRPVPAGSAPPEFSGPGMMPADVDSCGGTGNSPSWVSGDLLNKGPASGQGAFVMPPNGLLWPPGVRELEELRGKLSGLVGSVAGVAELRRMRAQLQTQEQALGTSARSWRPPA